MSDLRFLRQQDAVDMEKLKKLRVTLIGAGSIGSTTALWLVKMGVRHISVYDADIVEDHNQSNQLYQGVNVGMLKVEALQEIILQFEGVQIEVLAERYESQPLSEVVISGVDSMASRKAIWKSVRTRPEVQLYLDARMGLETLVVHAVRPQIREERQTYVKTLHDDANSLQEPCTARTICYTPLMAASVTCALVKRHVNQEEVPKSVVLDLVTWTMIG